MKDRKNWAALAAVVAVGLVITMCTARLLPGSKEEAAGTPETSLQAYAAAGAASLEDLPEESQAVGAARAAAPAALGNVMEDGQAGPEAAPAETAPSDTDGQPKEEASADMASLEEAQTLAQTPLDPAPSSEAAAEASEETGTWLAYYRNRLEELDAQIEKSRESLLDSSKAHSVQNVVSSELKLWDNELNAIYNAILEQLDEDSTQALVTEERAWMRERDEKAVEAAKQSGGGSMESVEYTASLAASTRERSYELLDVYGYVLQQPME